MRALLAIAALCLAAGCAGGPAVRPEGSPQRVVVVAASQVPKPSARTITGEVLGADDPREVVATEAEAALQSRGFTVLASTTAPGFEPAQEQVLALVEQQHADAAVVLVLKKMDLSALQPLGQMEVELETRLVGRDGRVLWSGTRRGATSERLYRAQADWRSHLRQAVDASVREVP